MEAASFCKQLLGSSGQVAHASLTSLPYRSVNDRRRPYLTECTGFSSDLRRQALERGELLLNVRIMTLPDVCSAEFRPPAQIRKLRDLEPLRT